MGQRICVKERQSLHLQNFLTDFPENTSLEKGQLLETSVGQASRLLVSSSEAHLQALSTQTTKPKTNIFRPKMDA